MMNSFLTLIFLIQFQLKSILMMLLLFENLMKFQIKKRINSISLFYYLNKIKEITFN